MIQFRWDRVEAEGPPTRALLLHGQVTWLRQEPAYLLTLGGYLKSGHDVFAESLEVNVAWKQGTVTLLQQNVQYDCTFRARINEQGLVRVEKSRRSGDAPILLNMRFAYQDAMGSPPLQAGRVNWQEVGLNLRQIPRSDWLEVLHRLEWEHYELFEVSLSRLHESPVLAEALKRLRGAQVAYREGRSNEVGRECRAALESAAKYAIRGDELKKGFAALFDQVFPGDPERQKLLDAQVTALSGYLHAVFRHEKFPASPATHEEAGFALANTLALFALVSRRLSSG